MKNFLIIIITGMVLIIGTVWADTVGDIDADGKITLTEAMGSLQISSGSRVASYITDKKYDMSEYSLSQSSGKKFWKQTQFGSGPAKTDIGIIRFWEENLNNQKVTAEKYEAGMWSEWNLIEYSKKYQYLGYSEYDVYSLYDPPVTNSIDPWSPGQRIINMNVLKSDVSARMEFREYELLGVENVTVPAGTFENCLKILMRRALVGRTYLYYLAKDIGTVKTMRADNIGNGYIWELIDIQKEDGTNILGGVCEVKGTWKVDNEAPCNAIGKDCDREGSFSMFYLKGDKSTTTLFLNDFSDWFILIPNPRLEMVTEDGITFLYENPSNSSTILLKIEDEIATATTPSVELKPLTLTGTVTCP